MPAMEEMVFSAPFPSDLTLVAQSTTLFDEWEDIATRLPGQPWTGSVTEASEGDQIRASLPASSDPGRFYRLQVTTP